MAAVIDTVPTTSVTVPAYLRQFVNGELPAEILRCPDLDRTSTALAYRMFIPVSWAMTAMQIAAKNDGQQVPFGNDNILDTTGRYRTADRQEALFRERYEPGPGNDVGCGSKVWNGVTWYLQRSDKGGCLAMAATPGTSNHGLGLADDIAEDPDQFDGTQPLFLDDRSLAWLRDNAPSFGFGLETRKERWHWHWIGGDTLSQRAADVLRAAGLTIPDLTVFGFTVPPPPQPPEDDMPTAEEIADAVYVRMMDPAEEGNTAAEATWRTKLRTANPSGVIGDYNVASVVGWTWNAMRSIQADLAAIRVILEGNLP